MHHAHSECPWYVVTSTPTPSQQLVVFPDDSKEEMTLEVPLPEVPSRTEVFHCQAAFRSCP